MVLQSWSEEEHGPPQKVEKEPPRPPPTNVQRHFLHVLLEVLIQDRFNAVNPAEFDEIMRTAEYRIRAYAELLIATPSTAADWRHCLAKCNAFQTSNESSRIFMSIDNKGAVNYYGKPGDPTENEKTLKLTYHRTPKFDLSASNSIFDAMYARYTDEEDKTPIPVDEQHLMTWRKSGVAMAVYDGRREQTNKKIMSAMKKSGKDGKVDGVNLPYLLRHCYSNQEFMVDQSLQHAILARNLPRKAYRKKANHSSLPEPLESVVFQCNKQFTLTKHPLKHVSLPGMTISRQMANLPLRFGWGSAGCRRERFAWVPMSAAAEVMQGCLKASVENPQAEATAATETMEQSQGNGEEDCGTASAVTAAVATSAATSTATTAASAGFGRV